METIKKIIFEGYIPYFEILKKILLLSSFSFFLVFFIPWEFGEFWEMWWDILIIVMFCRPLADIFPRLGILRKLVILRKELWILCGVLILAHGIWYFLSLEIPFSSLLNPNMWNPKNFLFWWLIWIIVMIPPLITSNKFSMKILKKSWKKIQKLSYLFFIFWAIHIALVDPEEKISMIFLSLLLALVWILAYKKIVLWK